MIKKLRLKFVIVTMSLLIAIFGIYLVADKISTRYWEEQETLELLEWYSANEALFQAVNSNANSSGLTLHPIYSIALDEDLNILESASSANGNSLELNKEIIFNIIHNNPASHRYKSYIYLLDIAKGGYHLTITDLSDNPDGIAKKLSNLLLIALAIVSLVAISFLLSRFVTEPAKRALEREKQFISDASHELKTPLAAISVNTQALQAEIPDNKYLQYILSETRRMDALIHKLLELSYLNENEKNIAKTTFSLSQCLEEMVLTMESSIFENKIKLEYNIQENMNYIGNKDDIKQVIAILLDNAMKHTPMQGTISLAAEKKGRHFLVQLSNTGDGIPQEAIPHLFERFYKADQSRSGGNYGLGLAIAKAILDAHEAAIHVASEPGKNTTFTITF